MKIAWKKRMTMKVPGLLFVAACASLAVLLVGATKLADDLSAVSDEEMKVLGSPVPQALTHDAHALVGSATAP
jgi:hypothetical protein